MQNTHRINVAIETSYFFKYIPLRICVCKSAQNMSMQNFDDISECWCYFLRLLCIWFSGWWWLVAINLAVSFIIPSWTFTPSFFSFPPTTNQYHTLWFYYIYKYHIYIYTNRDIYIYSYQYHTLWFFSEETWAACCSSSTTFARRTSLTSPTTSPTRPTRRRRRPPRVACRGGFVSTSPGRHHGNKNGSFISKKQFIDSESFLFQVNLSSSCIHHVCSWCYLQMIYKLQLFGCPMGRIHRAIWTIWAIWAIWAICWDT